MLDREVVFIADRVKNHDNATYYSCDLEKLSDTYFEQMWSSLNSCAKKVTYYSSPKQFLDHISMHKNSLVFSLWSGEAFRSRRALIPSICEAYGIPYVGADPYLHTICADKYLSKVLCNQYDINSSNSVIVSSTYDFQLLKKIRFPAVIKPNFEGGSIGIFEKNLVDDYYTSTIRCSELLHHFSQLIVEEYIVGEEVSVCIAGVNNNIDVFEVVRLSINGITYFDHYIYSAESKKMGLTSNTRQIVTTNFPDKEREKIIKLYKSMGKVEYMRIDGRINNNIFTLIELTPDCSLSPNSSMFLSFKETGFSTHAKMIEHLCLNALKDPITEYQNANT